MQTRDAKHDSHYLNENFMDCNENLVWGKQELLIHSYIVWYTAKGGKAAKLHFTLFSFSNYNF